ncbi:NADH-quinone oxidoreductase subunit N [Dietzia alimentaria]|uniref:NADH-quinone oxidoreductase subunit N n=1 Tax=Dietzia alimentaria TaxID=665550 RepID=UPI00029A26DA|nr:NADH-quinone oxidoreductase subunit N [Dietzia alimentaria]
MTTGMNMASDSLAMAMALALFAGAVLTLLTGSFLARHRQLVARLIAITALLGSAAAAVAALAGSPRRVFSDTFAVDTPTSVAALIIAGATLLVITLGIDELRGHERESEAYSLLLLAALGALVMAGATDLLVLTVGFFLASIPLYAIIGLSRTSKSAEATLKTYLLGALFGVGLLLGVTVLYGAGGATEYDELARALPAVSPVIIAFGVVAVLGGLLFKAGAVPAHYWVPDAAQGASTWAAAYATTVPKVGGMIAIYRFLEEVSPGIEWSMLVAVLAAVGMTLGNLAAFLQDDPRRLLGWSTISQVGYLLLPVAVAGLSDLAAPSLLLYLAGYAVTNITAFAVIAAVPQLRVLSDYRGLVSRNPLLAVALAVSLLSLVGTPPTAVFLGKLTTFSAAWDGGFAWLTVVAAVNTVASLFYYLRWLAPAFTPDRAAGGSGTSATVRRSGYLTALVGAGGILALGIGGGLLWELLLP